MTGRRRANPKHSEERYAWSEDSGSGPRGPAELKHDERRGADDAAERTGAGRAAKRGQPARRAVGLRTLSLLVAARSGVVAAALLGTAPLSPVGLASMGVAPALVVMR
jgi:hypothetical protein